MKIAAIQMCSGLSPDVNMDNAQRLCATAASHDASLVVLPENFAVCPHTDREKLAAAEVDGDGPIQRFLSEMAKDLGIWLVAGTIPIRNPHDAQRFSQASLLFAPDGQRQARYDKIHLFDVDIPDADEAYRESSITAPGAEQVVFETPFGALGMAIGYDLRFPELFRALSTQGLRILALPSAFTVATRRAHWETLVRARAIENQCVVVAAAQEGRQDNGRHTYGDSMIVDAWGRVQARRAHGEGVVMADIDLDRQNHIRGSFPALAHRRVDLWQ